MPICLTCFALLTMGSPPLDRMTNVPGHSQPRELPGEASLAGLQLVSDEDLSELRGGFTWEGVDVGLGAEIRTFLNGELVLQTNISWTAEGANTSQWVSGTLTPADATQLQAGILTGGGISMRVGDESVFLANEGQTAILHRTEGAIQNVLVNRASNIDARQEMDAVVDLDNFGDFQTQVMSERLNQAISDMINEITISGLNN